MLVLASASPRRQELLQRLNLEVEVCPANIDENLEGFSSFELAGQLSILKAQAVSQHKPQRWVLAADTVVALNNGQALGKPTSVAENMQFLRQLSGNGHQVHTGVSLIGPDGQLHTFTESTQVHFKTLSETEISWYAHTQEGLDKAGGYGIQGLGMVLVAGITGDFYNVMGLPMAKLWQLLHSSGCLQAGVLAPATSSSPQE